VLFTDGVPEARNVGDEEFGEERLKDFLRRSAGASAQQIASLLADRMREWTAGAEQHDDITFVLAVVR
jgi:sigma-B regulation protein RsbU (phosphoserine phosphatase)